MKLKQTFFGLFLLSSITANAQLLKKDILASQGSSHFVYGANKTYFIQESIGQSTVINTFNSATNYATRQGFLQPLSVSVLYAQFDPTINATIWPNPFSDTINVTFTEPVVGPLIVSIYDILGRKVFEDTFSALQELVIQPQGLSQGNYLFQLQSQARNITAKLIKH